MKLDDYLEGMRAATTVEELEAAIQAPFKHSFRGRTWSRICDVRIARGYELIDAHPHGRFVPRYAGGRGRRLALCGEEYRVGRGGNSTGVRYCWHAAGVWAMAILQREGFSVRASHRIWEWWGEYPHRVLKVIDAALAGEIPDPEIGAMIAHKRFGYEKPINYTVEQNDADQGDRRATRTCPSCGGTLFDWGAGWSEGFYYLNWHCNGCPDVFTQYLRAGELQAIRAEGRQAAEPCPDCEPCHADPLGVVAGGGE